MIISFLLKRGGRLIVKDVKQEFNAVLAKVQIRNNEDLMCLQKFNLNTN